VMRRPSDQTGGAVLLIVATVHRVSYRSNFLAGMFLGKHAIISHLA